VTHLSPLEVPSWTEEEDAEARFDDPASDVPRRDPDLAEFLDEPEPEHDWVVPDLIERADRVIVTGPEGGGKSTFLRQLAVQPGAGIHPFTLDEIAPVRTLIVDLENSRRHLRRQLRPLKVVTGGRLAPGMVRVLSKPAGIDLLSPVFIDWLDRHFAADEPELVAIGPLYKMATGDPKDEEIARQVALCLDELRIKYGSALVIEAHSPYATGGGKRPMRPYGASLWSRWPEFGLYLSEQGQLLHWRGARDERAWPAALKRGGEWPWTPESNGRALTFARILEETRAVGRRLSVRELAERTGADRNQIQRAIDANRGQYDAVCEEVGE
jgi:energy-coupling factor transporter ATP-binding protein EcfA2